MTCLTDEQLLAGALSRSGAQEPILDAAAAVHLRSCPECAARLQELQARLARVAAAHAVFDRGHAAARERLLAQLPLGPAKAGKRRWLASLLYAVGGTPMRRRLFLGGAAAVAVAIGLGIALSGLGSPLALAEVTAALRQARSYQCRVTFVGPEQGKKDAKKVTGTLYWAAPGSFCMDHRENGKLTEVQILHADKPGLVINYREETYSREDPIHGKKSPLLLLDQLARYRGQADRELGGKEIEGRKARGFEIAVAKVDPDAGEGTLQVWVDPGTKRPLRVVLELDMAQSVEQTRRMQLDEFRWDEPSEKWLDVKPPDRFADRTPNAPDVEKQTKEIVRALKTYAHCCGGKYPQVRTIYGDVVQADLRRHLGVSSPPTKEDLENGGYDRVMAANNGFAWMTTLQRHNSSCAYYGKTVGPQDKEKVLFRWKLLTGEYRVIYGDLRAETVTAEKLRKREGH
jgi:outer membrane lipoprotein-sorting protein